MAHKFDKLKYAALLVENLPRPIQSEAENERALELVERLCAKADLSPEEETLLEVLSCLIRAFEDQHYAIPPAPPARVLRLLLENRKLQAADLAPVLGSPRALNAILKGERAPDPDEAQKLGDFFNLSPATFRSVTA